MAKVRTTITIDEEALRRWQAIAEKEDRSLSSVINLWLAQVVEPAEWVAMLAEDQRGQGLQNVRAVIAALQVAQEEAVAMVRKAAAQPAAQARAVRAGGDAGLSPGARAAARGSVAERPWHREAQDPPPCNTGGKLPAKAQREQRK